MPSKKYKPNNTKAILEISKVVKFLIKESDKMPENEDYYETNEYLTTKTEILNKAREMIKRIYGYVNSKSLYGDLIKACRTNDLNSLYLNLYMVANNHIKKGELKVIMLLNGEIGTEC